MIASFKEIAANPEYHVNLETVQALANRVQELEEQASFGNSGAFVRGSDHDKVRCSNFYRLALLKLTQRNAVTKSDCAVLIAEEPYRASINPLNY